MTFVFGSVPDDDKGDEAVDVLHGGGVDAHVEGVYVLLGVGDPTHARLLPDTGRHLLGCQLTARVVVTPDRPAVTREVLGAVGRRWPVWIIALDKTCSDLEKKRI